VLTVLDVAEPHPTVVGIPEICQRLGVTRSAFDQWRYRNVGFPPAKWIIGGRPAWDWPDVESWAVETGRLTP
jgi:predicted DNA-binding transcriptional regulator AlpA